MIDEQGRARVTLRRHLTVLKLLDHSNRQTFDVMAQTTLSVAIKGPCIFLQARFTYLCCIQLLVAFLCHVYVISRIMT